MAITMQSSAVRTTLGNAIQTVEQTGERITITRHGTPAAALIPPDDLAVLEEFEWFEEEQDAKNTVEAIGEA